MKATIRKPNIQVLLHKVVTRTSADGSQSGGSSSTASGLKSQNSTASNVYDLTAWLGEGSSVHVQKSVRDSAGMFSITFVDQLMNGLHDGLAYLFEPMDLIEIRFAGDAYKFAGTSGQQLPIIMRGFVSRVRRSQTMGADGKPRRNVSVTGHDYQKLLQLIQIFNMPATPDVANVINSFSLFSKYGPDLNVQNSTDFVQQVFNLIVNPYIAGLQAAGATSGAALAEVATDIQVPDAIVSVQLGAFNSGNVQQLLEEYLDIGPFNEFFIEDRDAGAWGPAGPYAVYRPIPFRDTQTNAPLQPIQTSVTTGVDSASHLAPNANCVVIGTASIISIEAERSDANVANYFWCDAPRFNMNYDDVTKMYAAYATQQDATPYYLSDYHNVNPALYGLRKMETATQMGGADETDSGNGTAAGEPRYRNQGNFLDWINDRRNLLIAMWS